MAVASLEGQLVKQHLGQAARLQIWEQYGDDFRLVEERPVPGPGLGPRRWEILSQTLSDCRAVLASALGDSPRAVLNQNGISPVEMEGFVLEGLEAVYSGRDLSPYRARKKAFNLAVKAAGKAVNGKTSKGGLDRTLKKNRK